MSNYVSMAPETPKISAWGALVKVITEPKATFEKLGDAPAVFPGYLLQMVAAGVALWFTLPLSLKMAEEMMAANPGMPAEAVAVGKWAGVIGGSIGALAGPWISGVLLALVAMFFGQFQGSPVKFPAYLGMIGYARVPLAINTIIGGLLASQAASLQDLATKSLSLAVFLPADASPHLRALLEAFNPFDLWYTC